MPRGYAMVPSGIWKIVKARAKAPMAPAASVDPHVVALRVQGLGEVLVVTPETLMPVAVPGPSLTTVTTVVTPTPSRASTNGSR